MAFVNVSLLLGAALIGIPVVLHLIMRQRPKQLVFPALRFVHERRLANQRRLQLRHWLLLALRCGAICLLVLALARPSVASGALSSWLTAGLLGCLAAVTALLALVALYRGASRLLTGGFTGTALALLLITLFVAGRAMVGKSPILGDQEAPVAAAIVIDTSPRMQYRHENKTRIEAAQELAQWLLRQLPAESELAVIDSQPGSGSFSADRSAAAKAIERLRATGTPRPLIETVDAAIALLKQKPDMRRELYVLTDLTASAWKAAGGVDLKKVLSADSQVLVYVIDVGVEQHRNFALGEPALSGDVIPAGSDVNVEVPISSSGIGGERTVELWIEQLDPTLPILRDGKAVLPKADLRESRPVHLRPNTSERLQFKISASAAAAKARPDAERTALSSGIHQGWLRLVGQDGLSFDDVRYFAFEVQPAWPVLLVAPKDVSTRYLSDALAPLALRESGQASFRCDSIEQSRLTNQDLAPYRAVALLDPEPLTAEVWKKLSDFSESGGGVAIFLGHKAQPASFQGPSAIRLLGGKLTRQARTGGDVYLAPRSYDHVVLAPFRPYATSVPWDLFPVFYHWNLVDLASTARVVIPYSNGKPAVIESRLSRGSVLTMTTPISDPPNLKDRQIWNELATGEGAWPCFVLVYEMMQHLVRSGQSRLNLLAGETAVLSNDADEYPDRYQLFTPLDQPQDLLAKDGRVTVRFTEHPGAYRLRGQKQGPLVRGFAVNLAADTSDLTRLPHDRLDDILGRGRYQIAKSQDEINRAVGHDRIGSEFYPLLVTLLACVLGIEHLLANRFYRRND